MPTKHSAKDLGFKRRDGGRPVYAVSGYKPGQLLPDLKVEDAKTVTLKKGDESVLVQSCQAQADGSYVGEIYGFAPSVGVEYESMKIGDSIEFEESHAIGIGC